MRLFVRAVRRPDTNVFSTLASLACRDPNGFASLEGIHVVSGDGDQEFLHDLHRTARLRVHYGFHETYEKIRGWKPKRRAAWSYSYALQIAKSMSSDILITEDDIVAANGWYNSLQQSLREAQDQFPDGKWVVSGYYGFPRCPFEGSLNRVEECNVHPFWGNLMTFWPHHMLDAASSTFEHVVGTSVDMSTDLTVQSHLKKAGSRLLFTVPSIVQHAGDVTTLRPDGFRRSVIYSDGYREEGG